jgi:hypothetical protein
VDAVGNGSHRQKSTSEGEHRKLSDLCFLMVCMISVVVLKSKVAHICYTCIKYSLKPGSSELYGWSFMIENPISAKFIFAYSSVYISHTCKLWKQFRLIRVIDNHPIDDDDVTPMSTSSIRLSYNAIMMSYVTINLYLLALEKGYFVAIAVLSKLPQSLQIVAMVFLGCLGGYLFLRKSYGAVSRTTSENSQSTGTSTASSSQQSTGLEGVGTSSPFTV